MPLAHLSLARPSLARSLSRWLAGPLVGIALAVTMVSRAGATEHTVAPGENLTSIAGRYCTSVRDIVGRNAIADQHRILAGDRLQVDDRCVGTGEASGSSGSPSPLSGRSSAASTREIDAHLHLVPLFRAAADEFQVPADLLMAVTFTESRWREGQVSAAGAVGIGQILPATADWLRELMDEPALDERDPRDNVRMSARLLRFLLDRTDDRTRLALAAYYQGIGDVLRNGIDAGGDHYADVVLARRPWFASLPV